MLGVGGAKGVSRFDSRSGDKGVGHLNAVGECVLFNEGGSGGANAFGKWQDAELELAERLLNLTNFQL